MLFKHYHVDLVLDEIKTETRRFFLSVKPGRVYKARTDYTTNYFAKILVLSTWQEHLLDISQESVLAEGYQTKEEYIKVFRKINKSNKEDNPIVWAIKFKLIESNVKHKKKTSLFNWFEPQKQNHKKS